MGDGPFWRDLKLTDPLNQAIWDNSAAVQLEIGPPERLRAVNSIGAQQAMIEGAPYRNVPCLPWVPDLLTQHWKARSAILIVGSAYAGFIREYSGGKGMPIAEYVKAYRERSIKLFIDSFRNTVIPNWRYYDFTENLTGRLEATGNDVAGFALFDPCRASLSAEVRPSRCLAGSRTHQSSGGIEAATRQFAVSLRYFPRMSSRACQTNGSGKGFAGRMRLELWRWAPSPSTHSCAVSRGTSPTSI